MERTSGARSPAENRFTLLERLSVGRTSEVFVAEERLADGVRKVALKRSLDAVEGADENTLGHEFLIGSSASHPNLVAHNENGRWGERDFIVMEYVPGTDLWRFLRTLARAHQALDIETCLFVAQRMAEGVHALHSSPKQFVHADINPSNVLLSIAGDVKLADFGSADTLVGAPTARSLVQRSRRLMGYLSPEQVRGEAHEHRSDVYGVGLLLAEMILGRTLFSHPSELQLLVAIREGDIPAWDEASKSLPVSLADIVTAALSPLAVARPSSAAQLHDDLARHRRLSDGSVRQRLAELVRTAVRATSSGNIPIPKTADLHSELPQTPVPSMDTIAPNDEPATTAYEELSSAPTDAIATLDPGEVLALREEGALAAFARSLAERRNGLWVFSHGTARKEVFLKEGRPVFATSNLAGELLGEFLVSRKVITRGELSMALALLPQHQGKLGLALEALGLVDSAGFRDQVRAQVLEKLRDLFSWRSGTASFFPGIEPPPEALTLNLDGWNLCFDGAKIRMQSGSIKPGAMGEKWVAREIVPLEAPFALRSLLRKMHLPITRSEIGRIGPLSSEEIDAWIKVAEKAGLVRRA